jgi:hypothetical protein
MKIKVPKKKITLDDLAIMVAKGFDDTATKGDIAKLEGRVGKLEDRMVKLEDSMTGLESEMKGLRNSVNNYLKLSDKRYIELKNNQKILARYLKAIIEKSKISINTRELETVLK